MPTQLTIVDSYKFQPDLAPDLREEGPWDTALAQRMFGPDQLIVVTAGSTGLAEGIAHCTVTNPPTGGFMCCLGHLRELAEDGGCAVVALSDEPVSDSPPSEEHRDRWAAATALAEEHGYHLLDWLCCDDGMIRSIKCSIGLGDEDEWWDLA